VWQTFRNQLHADGLEIVTVGLETAGAEACRPYIEAAAPEHPSLIDQGHKSAELFGFINIPNAVWIDEDGVIVRPSETAPGPASIEREARNPFAGMEPPQHLMEIAGEAVNIQSSPAEYEAAIRDWVAKGADSQFALSADEVIARSQPRDGDAATGQAHFELAARLEAMGHHDDAVPHYREAHRLTPNNFSYKRQAWSLEPSGGDLAGPVTRFWQGPVEGAEDQWPYEGDWLSEVRAKGAENYYEAWKP
jgi:tetratricopeptide (TPR) repeat protein